MQKCRDSRQGLLPPWKFLPELLQVMELCHVRAGLCGCQCHLCWGPGPSQQPVWVLSLH